MSAERLNSQSPNERKQSQKQKLMTAYGISFPKMLAQGNRGPGHHTVGKIRPHSSKPQQQNSSTQPYSVASSNTNKPQTIMQTYSDFLPPSQSEEPSRKFTRPVTSKLPQQSKTISNTIKPQKPQQQTSKGGGEGLLDIKNMTEDHVREIANKADELIEIIKNIKAKAQNEESSKTRGEVIIEDEAGYGSDQNQNKDPNSWW